MSKGSGVHNGGDKGAGHDGGVEAQAFGQHREGAAHGFGEENGANQGTAHHRSHGHAHPVEEEEFCEVAYSQGNAA